jgi:hypothetical protein
MTDQGKKISEKNRRAIFATMFTASMLSPVIPPAALLAGQGK